MHHAPKILQASCIRGIHWFMHTPAYPRLVGSSPPHPTIVSTPTVLLFFLRESYLPYLTRVPAPHPPLRAASQEFGANVSVVAVLGRRRGAHTKTQYLCKVHAENTSKSMHPPYHAKLSGVQKHQ